MNKIYLDNAATTLVRREVADKMLSYYMDCFGNPSGIYSTGRDAKKALEGARRQVAKALNCQANEVFFTSGGTESDNWAIKGAALANANKGKHIISSTIEHHAVLHSLQFLQKQGYEVTYVKVDEFGAVDPEDVRSAIREDTVLITIMTANNEIGTIQPVSEIGRIARERGILFHTDAVQAIGAIPVDVEKMGVDLLSLSAHKFHGPKGAGVLYARKGVRLEPLIHGGAQERGRRAGTENIPCAVGLGAAIELAALKQKENAVQIAALRDDLQKSILDQIPEVRINGHPVNRLPNNLNISFKYIEGEALLLMLDLAGIAGSSGSACTSGSLDPSHVLLAIGLPHEVAHGSLRLTLSEDTTREEIDEVKRILPPIIQKLREMSPLYEKEDTCPN